ncbi:hypothetical protein EBA05_15700 [Xanthomonas oryzae pv. oryzae]|uniref:hypothetical protein n=1 Tax=Xanthomonas oryzae TaxID=347 RepID=UPI001058AF37|nr:hypothetical protein [Xanthomonas oryzae]QBN43713.1 hypothetical protein EBA05_15700 [Xanthomonas oryzae pv. oryzae]
MDIQNKLVGAMSILLTLFSSNVCWAKPNHAFFTVNTLLHFFFSQASLRAESRAAKQRAHRRTRLTEKHVRTTAFSKKHFFSAVFFSSALSQPLERFNSTVATPVRRHSLPPVRQLKIFFPTVALPTSHEQKCANLLRA